MIFHKIVVHDPRVCHDLDLRSYLQGQGHSAHIPEIGVRVITSHLLSMTEGCVTTLTQGDISDVKVTEYKYPKIRDRAITPYFQVGSGKYFTQSLSMAQGCVMTLTNGHISKFKVTENTYLKSVSGP